MNIRLVKIIISVSLLCIAAGLAYCHIEKKVSRFDLPEGELKWSLVRPQKAKMCIPAAFTDTDGNISGSYRHDGNIFRNGKALNMRVSLKGDLFYISSLSDLQPIIKQKLPLPCGLQEFKYLK